MTIMIFEKKRVHLEKKMNVLIKKMFSWTNKLNWKVKVCCRFQTIFFHIAHSFNRSFMIHISYETLTLPLSTSCVNITMMLTFCSQIIRQKSSRVKGRGPWVAIYSLCELKPWGKLQVYKIKRKEKVIQEDPWYENYWQKTLIKHVGIYS